MNQIAARAIRLPLKLIPATACLRVLSGPNRGMKWIAGAGVHGFWIGWYEKDITNLIRSIMKPGMRVFDVGANAGYYTLAMSRMVGAAGHVTAFEAHPKNVLIARRHIELNALGNVDLIEAAVAETGGTARFSGEASTGHISDDGITVRTVGLDEYDAPDFIKMDIEGGEIAALLGATSILKQRRTRWIVSTHGKECEEACRSTFIQHGYRTGDVTSTDIFAEPRS